MGTRLRPIYRARLYAPRSVDPTEATLLTPRAGSAHSDEFKVASKGGVAGYQPYLHGGPRGRSSEIDPLEKATDIGEQVWTVLDKRTGAGNLSRWLTAYVGDAKGGNQLLGLRFEVDESLDNGGTWSRFATSRVQAVKRSSGSKVWMQIYVRDVTDDLDNEIFVGPPHASASSYAHHAQVAPLGLLRPYGDFTIVSPIRATVGALSGSGTYTFRLDVVRTQGDPYRTIATKAFFELHKLFGGGYGSADAGSATVWIAPAGTLIGAPGWEAYDFYMAGLYRSTSINEVTAKPKTGTTTPALGASVDFYIETHVGGVSEALPLLINDTHPVTLLKDLLAGYFGKLTTAGAVTWAVPYNAANFATFEADTSLRKVRFIETTKANLHDWITENILRPNHLALKVNENGELEIVDFRRSSVTAPAFTLTNADLVSGKDSVNWDTDRAEAIAGVTVTYFGERRIPNGDLPKPWEAIDPATALDYSPPDIPTVRIEELSDFPVKLVNLGSRALDVGGKDYDLPARGLRFRAGADERDSEWDATTAGPRANALRAYAISLASDIRGPFGLGPTFYEIECRRPSANAALVKVGVTGVLDIDEIPDPATNLRGGQRLVICLSRIENGPRVRFRFLDWGANAVGTAPTLGAPVLSANLPSSALTLPVTLNADSQVARVDIAITSTGVAVRPAESSALWQAMSIVEASATITLARIAGAGQRVWIRARSESAPGRGYSLPSAWAFPAASYLDLTALAAPSAVNVTSPTGDTQSVTWTNGAADLATEVFLVAGAVAPTGLETERVTAALPAGSVQLAVAGRTTAGAQYTIGVRHVDDVGNISAIASYTFVAGAITALNPPAYPDGFSHTTGRSGPFSGFGYASQSSIGHYGIGVVATEFPSYVEVSEAIETGPGTGVYGAYAIVGVVESVPGDWTVWATVSPNDRKRRQLKARHTRDGATASAYTDEVIVTPGTNDPLAMAAFGSLSAIPTTFAGFGLTTELYALGDARWVQLANLNALGDVRWAPISHSHAATDIVSGTLADARLSANIPRIDAANVFTAAQTAPNFVLGGAGGGSPGDPGSPVAILEEGVQITPEVTSINFVGASVTASAVGSVITVNVTPTWASITGKPTTIGGYGITDFNSLGDARWLSLTGGTLSGILTTSVTNNFIDASGATTAARYMKIANTTGYTLLGVESSAGGYMLAGSSGYASVLTTVGTYDLQFGTNQTLALTINGTTQAAAFTKSVYASPATGYGFIWGGSGIQQWGWYADVSGTYLRDVTNSHALRMMVTNAGNIILYGGVAANSTLDVYATLSVLSPTTPIAIGNAGGYGMVSLNNTLSTSTGMGMFARVNGAEGLYLNAATSAQFVAVTLGGANAAVFYLNTATLYGDLSLPATKKLYLDGGSDTYLYEASANDLRVAAGGVEGVRISPSYVGVLTELYLNPTKRFYLDGVGDTYITEFSADRIGLYAGGALAMGFAPGGVWVGSGHNFHLDDGGDTYLVESFANQVTLVVGGTTMFFSTASDSRFYGNLSIPATKGFYLDGGSDTYFYEYTANQVGVVMGGTFMAQFWSGGFAVYSGKKLAVDGGGDTYFIESSANVLDGYTGGLLAMRLTSAGITAPNFILA